MMNKKLMELLHSQEGLTDIHLNYTLPMFPTGNFVDVRIRVSGDISTLEPIIMTADEIEELRGSQKFQLQINGPQATCPARLRITLTSGSKEESLFIRVLPTLPPPIELVGGDYFFKQVENHLGISSGLVLVAGKAGSGKSTFIASILQHYISNFPIHVVSIEDPVEYVMKSKIGYATQKEVNFDSNSFNSALRACMREDPDILFIGEIRDRETAETVLAAAESGHLVFGTIHAGSNAGIVDRLMVLIGGEHEYTAQRISQCLKLCVNINRDGDTFEYTYAPITEPLKNIIRNRTLHQWDTYALEAKIYL